MISCIYQRIGRKDTRKRYVILLGDSDDVPEDRLKDTEVIKVDDEMQLMEVFGKLLIDLDPEVTSGFNICKFDIPYLDTRLGLHDKVWPNFSRIPSEPVTVKTTEWSSAQYGDVSVSVFQCAGRITFDVYPYAERTFKLSKYNLDSVSEYVLGRGKHDVSPQYMFDTYAMTQKAIKSGDSKLMKDAKARMLKVLLYCVEDSELVIDIIEKTNSWPGCLEFSNASGINIEDLYLRGQQISTYALIYNKAVYRGYIVNHIPSEDFYVVGAYVANPTVGLHDNVIVGDLQALYPSIILEGNFCYTTYLPSELNDKVNDADFNIVDFDQEEEYKTEQPDGTKRKRGS